MRNLTEFSPYSENLRKKFTINKTKDIIGAKRNKVKFSC